jgi:hypothetical protein
MSKSSTKTKIEVLKGWLTSVVIPKSKVKIKVSNRSFEPSFFKENTK